MLKPHKNNIRFVNITIIRVISTIFSFVYWVLKEPGVLDVC